MHLGPRSACSAFAQRQDKVIEGIVQELLWVQCRRLVDESIRGRVQGHRAELFAARVAKASAALDVRCHDLPCQPGSGLKIASSVEQRLCSLWDNHLLGDVVDF